MCAQELGKQNPELLSLINSNQAEFLRLINEPAPAGGEAGGDLAAQLGGQLGGQLGEMLGAGGEGGAALRPSPHVMCRDGRAQVLFRVESQSRGRPTLVVSWRGS